MAQNRDEFLLRAIGGLRRFPRSGLADEEPLLSLEFSLYCINAAEPA